MHVEGVDLVSFINPCLYISCTYLIVLSRMVLIYVTGEAVFYGLHGIFHDAEKMLLRE